MGFLLSKIIYAAIQPLNQIVALLAFGAAMRMLRLRRLARGATVLAALYFMVIVATPAPEYLLGQLEKRFPRPTAALEAFDGAIVLGGGTGNGEASAQVDTWMLSESGERVAAIVTLRATRPDLPILHSGGSGKVVHRGWREGEAVRAFLAAAQPQGGPIAYEEQSRNTFENATLTAERIASGGWPGVDSGGRFLLVTSAWHMPRAMGAFRRAGLDVVAYPVDYWIGSIGWELDRVNLLGRLTVMDRFMIEAVGLIGYWALGRSDEIFPGPRPSPR